MLSADATLMEKLTSLCKRRGFVYPGSEIYGGLNAIYDFGPLGVELKNNIKKLWWKMFVTSRADMVGLESAILMNPAVWEASGHIANFKDPLVECKRCHNRFRADHIAPATSAKPKGAREARSAEKPVCPDCGGELTEVKMFNTMFKTFFGPVENESALVHLRPETAQGMFVNFKNIMDTMRVRIPFGVAQIGKAFRNEITTGNFIFRLREFEIMELEYFVKPGEWEKHFEAWLGEMKKWMQAIGLKENAVHAIEIQEGERAHYSKRTVDFHFDWPFGAEELYGLAYRTDFDLQAHMKASGVDLSIHEGVPTPSGGRDPDRSVGKKFVPHVIEPTFGLERTFLAVLLSAYEEVAGGRTTTTESTKDVEVVLHLPKALAPVKIAVLPLSKKEPLTALAQEIAGRLRQKWTVAYDEVAAIGRRYRRQDEIGTPYCVTVDFDSLEDKKVTVRDRDTMAQERVAIGELEAYLEEKLDA